MAGVGKPVTTTAGERDFMVQMLITLAFFVLFNVFYTASGFQYAGGSTINSLGFTTQAYPQFFSFLTSYGIVFLILLFGLVPIIMNVAMRLGGQLAMRLLPFPTQAFLNTMYDGYPWLPHYILSYSAFVIIVGTALSSVLPAALGITAASCFLRYGIDRGHHLLRVYQKPVPVDGTLVMFIVRLFPLGLVAKALVMMTLYSGGMQIAAVVALILAGVVSLLFFSASTMDHLLGMDIDLEHSQHQDAANYSTHQSLMQHGMVESYDPFDEHHDHDPTDHAPLVAQDRSVHQRESAAGRRASAARKSSAVVPTPLTAVDEEAPSSAHDELKRSTSSKASLGRTGSTLFSETLEAIAELEQEIGDIETVLRNSTATSDTGDSKAEAPAAAYGTFEDESESTDAQVGRSPTNETPLLGGHGGAHQGKGTAAHRAAEVLKATKGNDAWRPFVWRNPEKLPIVVRCPNSGEAAHVHSSALWAEHTSEVWGTARWGRSSRLSGASEMHTFDSWTECRAWMLANLRAPCAVPPSSFGGAFKAPAGSLGTALAPDGSPRVYMYTGVPVSLLAPTANSPKWLLTVSRDRGEFPTLQWKLVEADNRCDLQHLLQLHGCTDEAIDAQAVLGRSAEEVAADRLADGDALWEVQALAAELCTGQPIEPPQSVVAGVGGPLRTSEFGHGGVWTRWVGVLRAGSYPTKLVGVHTNGSRKIDWGLQEPTEESEISARLSSRHHLVVAAGTSPKLNAHVNVYMRSGVDWAEQFVHRSPVWPTDWLATSAPRDMLISHVAFHSESWTVVLTHATTEDVLAQASQSGESPPVEQRVLTGDEWPTAEVDALLAGGFTLTTVARAPGGRLGEPSLVVVLTRSPSTIMPRAMRSFGARELNLERWRCDEKAWHRNWAAAQGVTVAASHTAAANDTAADLCKLLPNGFPHWAYRQCPPASASGCELLGTSVLHVVDGDVGAFWSSGALSDDVEQSGAITVTIDLGTPRTVDEVTILWGDFEPLPMPATWRLHGAPSDSDEFASLAAYTDMAVTWPGSAPYERAEQTHECHHTCSRVAVSPPRTMQIVRISLLAPQTGASAAGRVGYSIRQVQVLGPGTAPQADE